MRYVRYNEAEELLKLATGRKTKIHPVNLLYGVLDGRPKDKDRFARAFGIAALFLAALLLVAGASAETIHVTGIHKATRDRDKTYRTSFDQNIITGTCAGKEYTLEQLAAFGAYHFEVGKDYPVLKITDNEIKIQVTDKKGRERTESLNVVEVKEQ